MSDLKARIRDLEKEIEIKDQELDRSQKELLRVNSIIESMIQDLNREVKWVHLIQKALNPTEIPNISGVDFSTKFVPGTKSGGDYFDIFEHEDKMKFGIIAASSSGYSMSALFLSILIKLSAQMEARRGLEPDEVVMMMTRELAANIENEDFSSLFYGVLDRRTFEWKYCSVGQIRAFLQPFSPDRAAKLERLEALGPAISKHSRGEKFPTKTLQLNARDRLILCSEGVGDPDFIGQAILKAPRSGVHELRNEILFQAEQMAKKNEPVRDQTVIVSEIKDRVIKLAQRR
jgi:sigma-B regulation protein RsbU (phosphoserine phosphatase)